MIALRPVLLALSPLLFTTAQVIAQVNNSNCAPLIQHGIYDTYRQTAGSVNSAQYKFDLCQAYNRLQTDKKNASVSGHYGLAGGEGNYSAEQLDQIGQAMCTATQTSTYSQSDLNVMQQVIDQSAIDAYKECVSLDSAGLKTKTTVREADAGQMTLDMYYVTPIGGIPQVSVKKIDISPSDAFTCVGPLWDMQGKAQKMDTHLYSMSCTRRVAAALPAGANILAPASTVTVMTDVGSVTRSFAALRAAPPPPPFDIPIGTIVAFSGSKEQAEAQTADGWWICDGRTVHDNKSPTFDGKDTPNLQGQFLMGDVSSGQTGGSKTFSIVNQTIKSHTTGGFGDPKIYGDPFTHMQGSHTWTTDSSIYSEGVWQGLNINTVPPFYTTIYLIRVR